MRNKVLMLILCLGGALVGCSSKPDIGDIRPTLQELWGPCAFVELSNLKKTNGVENGKTYRMAYSYTLEVLNAEGAMEAKKNWASGCTYIHAAMLEELAHQDISEFKKGDVIAISAEADMIKSEKGWIAQ